MAVSTDTISSHAADVTNTDREAALRALLAQPCIANLARAHQHSVMGASVLRAVAADQFVVAEGEHGQSLYFLVSGTAQAERLTHGSEASPPTQVSAWAEPMVLNAIKAGEFLGELSFLDGQARAASVRTTSDCLILEICGDRLDATAGDALRASLAAVVVGRSRQLSNAMVANLRSQLAIKTEESRLGFILMSLTVAIFAISTLLFYLVSVGVVEDVYDPGFSWQAVAVLAAPSLVAIVLLRVNVHELGLRTQRLGRTLAEAVGICAVLAALLAIYFMVRAEPPQEQGPPVALTPWFFAQYALHCAIQEVGMRGLYQGLMVRFLNDTKGFRAIALTSVVFGCLHVAFGIDAVAITFVVSLLLGMLYHWQNNIAGVIVVHFFLGAAGAAMLVF